MIIGIIYCYTNKINKKRYIGQTMNPRQRKSAHKSSAFNEKSPEYNSPLHRAFRKYGYENFSYDVLEKDINTFEELNTLERWYIRSFNTKIPNGYNILDGGTNCSHPFPEELKEQKSLDYGIFTKEQIIELRQAYANKESPSKIYKEKYSDLLNYNSFLNIWTGQRYKTIMPEVFNKKYRHRVLNEDIVKRIRYERIYNKLTISKIAELLNLNKSTVADVCKYKTWKNVKLEAVQTSSESAT